MSYSIKKMMDQQKEYTKNLYSTEGMSLPAKNELLKTYCLSLHNEITNIINCSDFKEKNNSIDKDNLLYYSIDIMRYVFAINNLYDISHEEIKNAYKQRNITLNTKLELKEPDKNDKIVVVDIDDVICKFRETFAVWIKKEYCINVDIDNKSYYFSTEIQDKGLSPENIFHEFVQQDGFLSLPVIEKSKEILYELKKNNYYIQLLTSRPGENQKCINQTFTWLKNNEIIFDNIAFTAEKYLWIAKKDWFINQQLKFAIDDSPKHAMEYASHGIKCYMPITSYNLSVKNQNIIHFSYHQNEFLRKFNL